MTAIARAHGVTPAQVVLRWAVQQGIAVIPKSARPERQRANLQIFGFSLSDAEMTALARWIWARGRRWTPIPA